MSTSGAFPLHPRADIVLGGVSYRLACTMRALHCFESATGKLIFDPDAITGPESALPFLRALLITEHPEVTEWHIGAASLSELQAGLGAAYELLVAVLPRIEEDAESAESQQGTNWPELWALARYDLRLSEAEFWSLSPLLWHELVKRLRLAQETRLYGHCITAAATTNCHIDPEKSAPIEPDYFMPGRRGQAAHQRMWEQQKEALREKLFGAGELLGARKVKRAKDE